MAIWLNENTKVITQGITGKAGGFHTGRCIAYGTNFVGGVTPGKSGQTYKDEDGGELPIFDTVQAEIDAAREALEKRRQEVEAILRKSAELIEKDGFEEAVPLLRGGLDLEPGKEALEALFRPTSLTCGRPGRLVLGL